MSKKPSVIMNEFISSWRKKHNLPHRDISDLNKERLDGLASFKREGPQPIETRKQAIQRLTTLKKTLTELADQLDDIQPGKEPGSLMAERNRHRFHRTLPRAPADQPCAKHHRAADHVTDQYSQKPLRQSQWRKKHARQNFSNRYPCPEPEQPIRKDTRLILTHKSPRFPNAP